MSELYKMILVDDEDDVRGRILSKIKEEMGFEVVGKAGNGYDALELIELHHPHVVLTDIKMPFIDGIELARIIRRDYPTTKVAFISGYDEFEYARKAIELNVVSYLMKPVTSNDIEEFLTKLKVSLDQEFAFLQDTNSIENRYKESIPILVNSYLNGYIQKKELDHNDILKLETYGLDLKDSNYVVGCISIGDDVLEEEKIFTKTLLDKIFDNYNQIYNFLTPDHVVFYIKDDRIKAARELDLLLFEILKYAEEYRDLTLQIGVSKVFHEFKEFPSRYLESNQAVRHSKYFNMGQIIYFEDIEDIEKRNITINENELSELEYQLKYGDKHTIRGILKKLLQEFESEEFVVLDHRFFNLKITNAIFDFANSLNVKITDVSTSSIFDKLNVVSDSEEYLDYVMKLIIKVRKLNVKSQVNKTEKLVEQAINYIYDNYQDSSLSLEMTSEYLNISVSYLSMLLKKIKGVTFNKFLVEVRMEKAKELLKFSNEKVVNIAMMVGYNEVYYFSHSFKKFTGMSPKEFRING
jgi:two-component system response regulator YesN